MNNREIQDKSEVIIREIITSNKSVKTYESIAKEIIDKNYRKHHLEKQKKSNVKNSVVIDNCNIGYSLIGKQEEFLKQLYHFLTEKDNRFIGKTNFIDFRNSFKKKLPQKFRKIVWNADKAILYKLIVFLKEVEIIEGSIWVATKNIFTDTLGGVLNLSNSNRISENNSDYKKLYNGFIKPFKEKNNF